MVGDAVHEAMQQRHPGADEVPLVPVQLTQQTVFLRQRLQPQRQHVVSRRWESANRVSLEDVIW